MGFGTSAREREARSEVCWRLCAMVAWHLGGKQPWLLLARPLVPAASNVDEAPLPMLNLGASLSCPLTTDSVLKVLLQFHVAGGGRCGARHLIKGRRRGTLSRCSACFCFVLWFFSSLCCLFAVTSLQLRVISLGIILALSFFVVMRCACGLLTSPAHPRAC